MRRTVLPPLAMFVALVTSLMAVSSFAQEASPPLHEEEIELPPGVSVAVLTQLAPFDLPDEPVAFVMVRLVMEPGSAIPPHPHPGGEFGVVEAGSVTVGTVEGPAGQVARGIAAGADAPIETADPGEELTANAGDAVVVPTGNVSDTRAGPEGATILIFEFAPLASGTPEA